MSPRAEGGISGWKRSLSPSPAPEHNDTIAFLTTLPPQKHQMSHEPHSISYEPQPPLV